jgi:rare lipoprotein A (peptidoglycan hydrolase)
MDLSAFRRVRILIIGLSVASIAVQAQATQGRQRGGKPAQHQVTSASWYGASFHGRRTASGAVFNAQHLTAAHRTLHMGSKVRVTELRSGRSVVVQITDRGPFYPGRGIDLSYAAARQLGILDRGVARVAIEPLAQERSAASNAPIVTALSGPALSWLPKAIVE